jgi:hypothetical protein
VLSSQRFGGLKMMGSFREDLEDVLKKENYYYLGSQKSVGGKPNLELYNCRECHTTLPGSKVLLHYSDNHFSSINFGKMYSNYLRKKRDARREKEKPATKPIYNNRECYDPSIEEVLQKINKIDEDIFLK